MRTRAAVFAPPISHHNRLCNAQEAGFGMAEILAAVPRAFRALGGRVPAMGYEAPSRPVLDGGWSVLVIDSFRDGDHGAEFTTASGVCCARRLLRGGGFKRQWQPAETPRAKSTSSANMWV